MASLVEDMISWPEKLLNPGQSPIFHSHQTNEGKHFGPCWPLITAKGFEKTRSTRGPKISRALNKHQENMFHFSTSSSLMSFKADLPINKLISLGLMPEAGLFQVR